MRSSDRPPVSFLVVSHNKGKWLEKCIMSILAQTYPPAEIIICDNGSTDQSPEIVRGFEGLPNVKYIFRPEALGVSRAINLDLSNATGEYVAMLGADDVARPNHLELVMGAAITDPSIDVVFGDLEEIDVNGKVVRYVSAAKGLESIYDFCSVGHATGVTKKAVYDEIGGYDEKLGMSVDWEFILRALKAGKKIVYCGKTGYQWRRFPGSDQITIKNGAGSEVRRNSHAYIRQKYNLSGPCRCGCGAVA